jgi:hypothetical protein
MRTVSKWLVAVAFIGGLGVLLNEYAGRTDVPKQLKLAECTNAAVSGHLVVPKGDHFNLVLGAPDINADSFGPTNKPPPFTFSGCIRVSGSESSAVEFPFSSEASQQCNWLQSEGIPVGYILTWNLPTNHARLDRLLIVGERVDFDVRFEQPPPTNTSVWLTWLQRYKDRDKK